MALDTAAIKKDFPIFDAKEGLVFLDSAASSQKPRAVIDAMSDYYERSHANVHRGVYALAEEATARYEGARSRVARFINAPSEREVLFSKNVTESLNLVAGSWGRANLRAGDVVVLTEMEHHANIVPWLMLREERGIEIRYVPVTAEHVLDLSNLDQLLDGAKLLSFTAMSNVLGTINPVRQLTDAAHAAGAVVCVDAAQLVPHQRTDVQALDVDLLAFTLDKTSGSFSPTTRYRDYAVSRERIHWESQSITRADSDTGRRYQHHQAMGRHVMLFTRHRTDDRGFWFLGPATYVRHIGEKPMAITWQLDVPLPGDLFTSFAAAVA